MGKSILPNGEELLITPEELLRYLNPDGIRQLLRQERLHWNLKPNRDADYYDNTRLFKYTSEIHNEGCYEKMEIRTFPDNDAWAGYAGIHIDSGVFGIVHNLEKWNKAMSEDSIKQIVNRLMLGAMAKIPNRLGYGFDENKNSMEIKTDNRIAAMIFDPYDGRAYLMSNDDPNYVNNETRAMDERLPERTIARIGDIPTRITQLKNDLDFISDPDYRHTDNNFTDSNRYILDNIDDRTFVYPEISKDKSGDYIENTRVGLNGKCEYGESDGIQKFNTQPDLSETTNSGDLGDRFGEAINSHGIHKSFSGVNHDSGYFPGIFRSYEELERVDLIDQRMEIPIHRTTPGAKRASNYYIFDGKWGTNWFDRYQYKDSYLAQSMNPNHMEIKIEGTEPTAYSQLEQSGNDKFDKTQLYQWRYNRVTLKYYSRDITISIMESGEQYRVDDILRWTFGDDVFLFIVKKVGPNGQILEGEYRSERERIFEQDPSTHGVGILFSNMSGVGHGAKLIIHAKVTIETHASQIKNNLYAYVDITPSVRSDNSQPWSDTSMPDTHDGKINVRSTAAAPAYSGINSGRGGPEPNPNTSKVTFHEHGGNATAGTHVHLFRYVINTQNPTWVIRNGIQIFTGKWVDQGPMGVERPCDIKALLFSNPDTNNFNNYYKFMIDSYFDSMNRNPDSVITNNPNATSPCYLHVAQRDPESNQRFTDTRINPETNEVIEVDITDRVLYVNAATGILFLFNSSYKNDPTFGYGMRAPGWIPFAGATTR